MAYTMENLLSLLHPCCPAEADALCKTRRRVERGLTTVELKIHCLGGNWQLLNLIKALGGRSEVIGNICSDEVFGNDRRSRRSAP